MPDNMKIEYEARFLNIDKGAYRKKLEKLGAKLISPERLMRRRTYDFPDKRLAQNKSWLRVRDEGDRVTISLKQRGSLTLDGIKEHQIETNDFDQTCDLFLNMGMIVKAYQETRREKWLLQDVEITIDSWPWIPVLTEIEGPDEASVRKTAKKLDFNFKDAIYGSIADTYTHYFDITRDEINWYPSLTFIPTPAWFEERRKK